MTINALVWHPYFITLPGNVPRCSYRHTMLNGIVFVLDCNGQKSVLEDASRVCREMHDYHRPYSTDGEPLIMYRNNNHTWQRMEHVGGKFKRTSTLVHISVVRTLNELQDYLP